MKSMRQRFRFQHTGLVSLVILTLSVLACSLPGAVSQQGVAEVAATPPPIPTRPDLTETPTSTPTPTFTPTITVTPSLTPTATPTDTPTPTLTPSPTLTITPSLTPTIDPFFTPSLTPTASDTPEVTSRIPTATPIPNRPETNRLSNPGFEGQTRPVIFGEVNVFTDWEPFYCDVPYSLEPCPAKRRDTSSPARPSYNEPDLLMGRPEYKIANVEGRYHGGISAQQWFCFFRVCQAGVYQQIDTKVGERCEVSAYVQTWSANDSRGTNGTLYTSDKATQDDQDNSVWRIRVDPNGGTYAFSPDVLVSRDFTYADGHYDKFIQIRATFTATSNHATIFFENLRIWPFTHNDSYIDDAAVQCIGG